MPLCIRSCFRMGWKRSPKWEVTCNSPFRGSESRTTSLVGVGCCLSCCLVCASVTAFLARDKMIESCTCLRILGAVGCDWRISVFSESTSLRRVAFSLRNNRFHTPLPFFSALTLLLISSLFSTTLNFWYSFSGATFGVSVLNCA